MKLLLIPAAIILIAIISYLPVGQAFADAIKQDEIERG